MAKLMVILMVILRYVKLEGKNGIERDIGKES